MLGNKIENRKAMLVGKRMQEGKKMTNDVGGQA
jgi:hypothetical protein